ncbi:MAG: hypothetical protein ABI402_20740 [Ferruginibacter sp.]
MKKLCKIAELGMLDMLFEMKNPLTNIMLCLEVFESGIEEKDTNFYYNIIKNSAIDIESSIKELCASFHNLGFSLAIAPEEPLTAKEKKALKKLVSVK